MAVYFEPRKNTYSRGWGDYLGEAAMQFLGHGLERNRNAQQYELGQRAENEAMARKQAEIDMRGERVRGLTFDPSNPSGMTSDVLIYAAQNPEIAQHLSGILGQTAPQNSPISVNLGNRMGIGAFNPRGGVEDMQFHDIGVNPTEKYGQDAATTRARITDSGATARNTANIGVQRDQLARQLTLDQAARDAYGAPIQTADGEWVFPRQSDGTIKRTEIIGPDPSAGRRRQGLRTVTLEGGEIALVDPETGEITPTGYKGQPRGNQTWDSNDRLLEKLEQENKRRQSQSTWYNPFSWFNTGGTPANVTPLPQQGPPPHLPQASARGGDVPEQMEAQVQQMMDLTGRPREEVIAYLQQQQMF